MESICFFTSIYTLYLYTLIWYTLCKHTSSTKTCNICIDNSIKVGQPMIQELYDQIVSNGKVHRGWRTLAVLNSYHSSNNNKRHQQQKWNYRSHLLHLEWYQVYFDDRERFEHIRKRYCWVICWLILEMLLWTRVCKIERDSERNNCEAGCTALIKIIYKEKFQHGCRWLFFDRNHSLALTWTCCIQMAKSYSFKFKGKQYTIDRMICSLYTTNEKSARDFTLATNNTIRHYRQQWVARTFSVR